MTVADKFTEFKLVQIVRESDIISSFHLVPQQPMLRPFVPGEYLLFEHVFDEVGKVRREYSISGIINDAIRVTIKHETAQGADMPDGLMSSRFHTQLKVGDVVRAAGPVGAFLLDRSSKRPVILLSGGVGLTPLVAMAHDLVASNSRPVHFIHACENGRVHAMRDEIHTLEAEHEDFHSHFVYRAPDAADLPGRDYNSQGFVTRGLLEDHLPTLDCDFYLCGPGPFMQAMYDVLFEMGVPAKQIRYEFFGPATVLKPKVSTDVAKPEPVVAHPGAPLITFAQSGLTVPWDPASENLLEFAEDQGVMVDFSCRAGTCDTCKTRILSGEVQYPVEPFERPREGLILMCCSVPDGDLELDA